MSIKFTKICIILKNYLPLILSLLFFSSCLKDDDAGDEPTIDWETFGYVIDWTETGSKTGDSDWENISDGQQLSFFSNYVDDELRLPNNGKILYEPSVITGIKNEDYFERTDSTFVIYSSPLPEEADTIIVSYSLIDSSTLIITDTSVSPVVEIKFQRKD
ncbi:hypothetical protein GM418_11180 [Maribellus comscasis]|uniref:Uncharacterized protein n=1 Tax=Maribellus comscasis TaxID=2681766 RepID=A0A6I6JSW8_9BACT|nr:hypothetical protein [Maribellus comscasis]QGY44200.1 hypothetical protein GM418_11180 [Maribellus comscasis]